MKRDLFSIVLILAVLFGPVSGPQVMGQASDSAAAAASCFVDDTAKGLNNGSSWKDAYISLQPALARADCTIIVVAEGTYTPTSGTDRRVSFAVRSNVRLYGGFPNGGGTPDPKIHLSILSGNIGAPGDAADNSYHVITMSGVSANTVVDGFTIQDGNANDETDPSPPIPADRGGGFYIAGGNPTLRNLVIRANSAGAGGCGMYLLSSSPALSDVLFSGNTGVPGGLFSTNGGGIWSEDSSPTLTRVQFYNQTGIMVGGGFASSGNPVLTDVEFVNNDAYDTGGMSSSGNASLNWVTFQGNSASGVGGLSANSGTTTIRNSRFFQNSARIAGGIWASGNIVMIDSLISQNIGYFGGGGLVISQDANASGTFINLTVSGNTSGSTEDNGNGGGIRISSPNVTFINLLLINNSGWNCAGMENYGTARIVNATIAGNYAYNTTGAICAGKGTTTMINTIVWGNSAAVAGQDILATPLTKISTSMVDHGCPVGATCSNLVSGSPQFQDVSLDNYHLKSGSAAINTGSAAALPADTYDLDGDGNKTEKLPYDLDHNPRVAGKVVDLGVYETQAQAQILLYIPYVRR